MPGRSACPLGTDHAVHTREPRNFQERLGVLGVNPFWATTDMKDPRARGRMDNNGGPGDVVSGFRTAVVAKLACAM